MGKIMIDHLGLKVGNLDESKTFYEKTLASLGYTLIMEHDISGAGFGKDGMPKFWIKEGRASGPLHIAFACSRYSEVDVFYETAIRAGGIDNGSPGLRTEYHPNYYGAFVLDPDGNNIEAVCHFE